MRLHSAAVLRGTNGDWTLKGHMQDELLGRQSAFQEAEAQFQMIGDDNTVEELREPIAVPPRIEWALRAYARAHPEEDTATLEKVAK